MQGYVRNLVIANSQAERFEALIETVRRKGVTQKISVEAINKISIMGTGSASAILSTGIYKLFEQYKYAKIGFKGKLKNDNFLLGGIVTEGNKEYIVKGGILPPKVNIISHTRNVSFQEMVKRLNSIKQIEKGEKIRVE
ncbi:MAG TPA: hypothetical protein ENG93_02685 [Nitrospirae bacterium]|nr:hypothetical protein [Nitrospirota bacterium]